MTHPVETFDHTPLSLSFPGDRFVRSEADKDIVIILDGNGYIAGMQTVIMKEKGRHLNDVWKVWGNGGPQKEDNKVPT